MTSEEAYKHGREDGRQVLLTASASIEARVRKVSTVDPEQRYVLCDGTYVSPSWRALAGGSRVYNAAERVSAHVMGDLHMAYEEGFGDSLCGLAYWEDGLLVMEHDVTAADVEEAL